MIFPQDEQTLGLLARVLDSLQRYREAGLVYERAIAVDPRLARLHAYYARHLAAVGRLEEAEAQLAKAEELDGTHDFKAFSKGTPLDLAAEPAPM